MTADRDRPAGAPLPGAAPVLLQPDVNLTDTGNAILLRRLHGRDIRYVKADREWYLWNGAGLWKKDETGEIVRRALSTVRDAQRRAVDMEASRLKKAVVRHYLQSENEPAVRHMLTLAQSLTGIAAAPADFDRDPWLLNVMNGVIDLRSGVFSGHDRDHLCTRQSPVVFDPAAACPRWERFLDEILLGDKALFAWIRKALGYSLTGITSEEAVFLAFGVGANGKSVLLDTMQHIMGNYATVASAETFLKKRDGDSGPRNDLACLNGIRLVTAHEPEEGAKLAEGFLKSVTGADLVTARFLHREFFQFRPQFKLWFSTNHRPRVRGSDEGIWRRLKAIPFRAVFGPDERDTSLPKTLRAEAPGILAWLVRAAADWHSDALGSCPAIADASASYRAEQDLVGAFLAEQCSVSAELSDTSINLYRAFKDWCAVSGEKIWTLRSLTNNLHDRGFARWRSNSDRGFYGLSVKN